VTDDEHNPENEIDDVAELISKGRRRGYLLVDELDSLQDEFDSEEDFDDFLSSMEKQVTKALSKTKLILNEILALEEKIKEDPLILQEMFDFTEEDLSEGKLEGNKSKIIDQIEEIRKLGRQLEKIPEKKSNIMTRGRLIVQMSRIIRNMNVKPTQQERIIDSLREKLRAINESHQ